MGNFAACFAQVSLVDFLNQGILMTLAQRHIRIFVVQRLCPHGGYASEIADHRGLQGLATAVDAAAGTGHNFNEVILPLARTDILQHLFGISSPAEHAHPHSLARNLVNGLLNTMSSPDLLELDLFQLDRKSVV